MSTERIKLGKFDKMPIIGVSLHCFLNHLRKKGDYTEDELEVIEYYYLARLGDVEKFLWISVIFAFISIQALPILLVTSVLVLSVRQLSGGFHSRSTWGCFAWTLLAFLLAIFVLPLLEINGVGVTVISVFSVSTAYRCSPIRSADREPYIDKRQDKKLKYMATTLTALWLAPAFFYPNHVLIAPVMWAVFLQNVQLLIEYYKRKHDRTEQT